MTDQRTAHVYCGNTIAGPQGMDGELPECHWEGDVPLPEHFDDDFAATFDCPGCGLTNLVADHSSEQP